MHLRNIDRHSAHMWSLYQPIIVWLSTQQRPTMDQLWTDCQPTLDSQVSTICRPQSMDRLSIDTSTNILDKTIYSNHDPKMTHIAYNTN